jgi:hypothetical protein
MIELNRTDIGGVGEKVDFTADFNAGVELVVRFAASIIPVNFLWVDANQVG